ncbi:hypothetical protein ZWY2020_048631 [Hordeum vulgare]|nr:hypothetical protein ZWY2020_048631 [Hordeum vulgare]
MGGRGGEREEQKGEGIMQRRLDDRVCTSVRPGPSGLVTSASAPLSHVGIHSPAPRRGSCNPSPSTSSPLSGPSYAAMAAQPCRVRCNN